jgi:hypothetical protein
VSSCRASASVTVGRMHADEAPRCDSLHIMMTFIIRSRAMHRDNQAESECLFRKLFERSVGFVTLRPSLACLLAFTNGCLRMDCPRTANPRDFPFKALVQNRLQRQRPSERSLSVRFWTNRVVTPCSNAVRMAAVSASVTVNMPAAWEGRPCPASDVFAVRG